MTVDDGPIGPEHCSSSLAMGERLALALVYTRPLSWHVPTARMFGVRVIAAEYVDHAALEQAEGDSRLATRYLAIEVTWGVVGLVLLALWGLVFRSISPWSVDNVFPLAFRAALAMGFAQKLAADIAFIVAVAAILLAAVACLAVYAVPLVSFARRSSLAASSGLSLALYVVATGTQLDLSPYPRLDYSLSRLLRGVRLSGGAANKRFEQNARS